MGVHTGFVAPQLLRATAEPSTEGSVLALGVAFWFCLRGNLGLRTESERREERSEEADALVNPNLP